MAKYNEPTYETGPPTRWDRYIGITMLARAKYADPDGTLVVQHGNELTQYSKVEEFTFNWLLRNK